MANTPEAVRKPAEFNERNHSEERRPQVAGEEAVQHAREAGQKGAEAVQRTGAAAAEVARRAAIQGEEAAALGLRAIAGAQRPIADLGLDQSRRMVEQTARVTEIYRDAAERTSEDVQALMTSLTSLGRGVQNWQHAYLDLLQQGMGRVSQKQQELYRCGSIVEVAAVQRDLYLEGIRNLFTTNTTLLQLAGQIAQDAVRPLQERARTSAAA